MEGISAIMPTFSSYSFSSTGISNLLQKLCLFTICIVKERKKESYSIWAPKKSFSILNKRPNLFQNLQPNVV